MMVYKGLSARKTGGIFVFLILSLLILNYSTVDTLSAQEADIRYSFLEPHDGAVYYPGGTVYISLQMIDDRERVKSVAFYVTQPNSGRPREPFFIDKESQEGWAARWAVPLDAQEGWYRITAQAFDRNGIRKGREISIPVMVKSPQVRLNLTTPVNGQKCYEGQTLTVAGDVIDPSQTAKRVDFFVNTPQEAPREPFFQDKTLSDGFSAKLQIPKSSPGEYSVLVKAFDSATGGNPLAEAKARFVITQPEMGLRIAEPQSGKIFYPGQKLHVYGEVNDPTKKIKKVRCFLVRTVKDSGKEPFATDRNVKGSFKAACSIPYDIELGSYHVVAEATGDDEKAAALTRQEVSISIEKPIVNMNVLVPSNGAYYYTGEEMYVNVGLEDRAGIVERVTVVVYPLGNPMSPVASFTDKIFTDGCGTMFLIPDKKKNPRLGQYVVEIVAKDGRGATLCQKNIHIEIRE